MTDYEELEQAQADQVSKLVLKYRDSFRGLKSLTALIKQMQEAGDLVEILLPLKGEK